MTAESSLPGGSPDALAFVRAARVGRLATVDRAGRPSVVPFCFAVLGSTRPVVVSVLDEKPKRVADRDLARVRNIARHPWVAFVVDRYDEEWSHLAYVQVKGEARIVMPGDEGHASAIAALREKYPQYRAMAIEARPIIRIGMLRWKGWRGDGTSFA